MTDWKIKFVKRASLRNVEAIKAALTKPMSIHELSELVYLEPKTVRRYVSALRFKEQKEIYVAGHRILIRKHGKPFPVPLYAVGNKRDAVFKAQTKAENSKLYIERRKADPERWDLYLAKIRASNLKPKQQDELAYFFGRAA